MLASLNERRPNGLRLVQSLAHQQLEAQLRRGIETGAYDTRGHATSVARAVPHISMGSRSGEQRERSFEQLAHAREELSGVGAVEDAVVAAEREVHQVALDDLAVGA